MLKVGSKGELTVALGCTGFDLSRKECLGRVPFRCGRKVN